MNYSEQNIITEETLQDVEKEKQWRKEKEKVEEQFKTIKRKKILKWIRKNALQLQPEIYTSYPKEYGVNDPNFPPDIKQREHWYSVPTDYHVNHYRRLKRIASREGFYAMDAYFKERGFAIKSYK